MILFCFGLESPALLQVVSLKSTMKCCGIWAPKTEGKECWTLEKIQSQAAGHSGLLDLDGFGF